MSQRRDNRWTVTMTLALALIAWTAPLTAGAGQGVDLPAPKDVAAPPADADKTSSGLAWKVLKPAAASERPAASDTVKVHYSGWTTDGKMFDSSVKRGQPASFPLNRVIKGWTEGVQLMSVGEKSRFWIPAELAYGNKPGRPAGMLVFDIELLEIKRAPAPPQTPKDVAAPPADATVTKSGLAWRMLNKGPGGPHPSATDRVTVHYSGWTTGGRLFDSSVTRGRPATFPLDGVIKGWTEGVQLLSAGDKARFWIPAAAAYGDNPGGGRPGGMLVFDIELLQIGGR